MLPVSTSEMPVLSFSQSEPKRTMQSQAPKIGWLRSVADKPGATFDIKVQDALGRTKFERKSIKTETKEFGELVNFPTLVGEELHITVENIRGAEKVDVFLN